MKKSKSKARIRWIQSDIAKKWSILFYNFEYDRIEEIKE